MRPKQEKKPLVKTQFYKKTDKEVKSMCVCGLT